MIRPNILFVTNVYLSGRSGGLFATSAWANAFYEISEGQMTLVYPIQSVNDLPSCINSNMPLIGCADNRSSILKMIHFASGRLTRYTREYMDKCLAKLPDVNLAVLDTSFVGGALSQYFQKRGIRVVVLHQNIESEYNIDNRTPASFWGFLPGHINRNERIAAENCHLNLMITPADAGKLHALYPKCRAIETLGVFEYSRNRDSVINNYDRVEGIVCAITGSLSSLQTYDGLLYFFDDLLQPILDICPQAKFIIAGRSPNRKIRSLCSRYKQIELVDSPSDMSSVIQRANLYLCPTRLGGGLKLRIMDGLKMGLPVIAHKISTRGYEQFVRNEMMLPFDSTESMVSAFQKIANRIVSGEDLSPKIRLAYEQVFTFESGVSRLRSILNESSLM